MASLFHLVELSRYILEKAYAKIHGDYDAIQGGWPGEGVEDLTGGVTITLQCDRVFSKEKLWRELVNEDKEFLFSVTSLPPRFYQSSWKNSLATYHAYSLLAAVEEVDEDGNPVRLIKIRNPWGERSYNAKGEWDGAWSNGSKEWTPYWMAKLKHRFGNDGIFWMSFDDMLTNFDTLDRTRLFGWEWTVVQRWTTVSVSCVTGYLKTKFRVRIAEAGPVVIVLSQLDSRYYRGLEGQYTFELYFVLRDANPPATGTCVEEIVRARGAVRGGTRSVSAEVDLRPGEYDVLPKILAQHDPTCPLVEDVVREYAEKNPQKLRQIGVNHDIANAKGLTLEELPKSDDRAKDATAGEPGKMSSTEKEEPPDAATAKDEPAAKYAQSSEGKPVEETKGTKEIKPVDGIAMDRDGQETAKDAEEFGEEPRAEAHAKAPEEAKTSISHHSHLRTKCGNEASEPGAKLRSEPEPEEKREEEDKKGEKEDKKDEKKDEKGDGTDDQKDDEKAGEEDHDNSDGVDETWNAVCVIGLRVYSKTAGAVIDIVTPKDSEGASLQIDTKTSAGATT